MQNDDIAHLYMHLQALDTLYRQKMLGDFFVDITNTSMQKNTDIHFNNTHLKEIQLHETKNDLWHQVAQKVMQCKLCSLSKNVKDSERLCGVKPVKKACIDKNAGQHDDMKIFPNIAFITDFLHLKEAPKDGYALLCNLELNRSNEMLFDIVEKVFLLDKDSVFLIPLFKCAEVGDNQQISMQVRTQTLTTQRRICGSYLYAQLEDVGYAVFFGERICFDFFEITLKEASGKLLEHYTEKGKKVICVCVPDIMQMLMNPKLKKDAFVNFVLLRNAIYANSC